MPFQSQTIIMQIWFVLSITTLRPEGAARVFLSWKADLYLIDCVWKSKVASHFSHQTSFLLVQVSRPFCYRSKSYFTNNIFCCVFITKRDLWRVTHIANLPNLNKSKHPCHNVKAFLFCFWSECLVKMMMRIIKEKGQIKNVQIDVLLEFYLLANDTIQQT